MPEYLAPGVYVEETSFRSKTIEGVSTSTAGFIGPTRFGPLAGDPDLITSLADFERTYGGLEDLSFGSNYVAHAVRAFFEEGGRRLYVSRVFNPTGLTVNTTTGALPGYASTNTVSSSPPAPQIDLVARFPGVAGNMRVTMTLRAGVNILNILPDGTRALTRAREFMLLHARNVGAPVAGDGLFVLRRDTLNNRWELRGNTTTLLLDSALLAGAEVRPVTVLVDIERPTVDSQGLPAFRAPESLGEFELDSRSPMALIRTFALSPLTRFLFFTTPFALELPTELDPKDKSDTQLDLIAAGMAHELLQPALPALLATSPALSAFQVIYTLTQGADGVLPIASHYEGQESGFSDYLTPTTSIDAPKNGIRAFEAVEDISIVAAPGYSSPYGTSTEQDRVFGIQSAVINHCEKMRYRVAILDAPPDQLVTGALSFRNKRESKYAALYYPWIYIADPFTGNRLKVPPSGHMAGIYARNDIEHAVFKTPANEVVRLAIDFEQRLNKAQQEALNPNGVNCLRFFDGRGFLVWGGRTISTDSEWKYLSVRRYFAYLERSIDRGTQWVVFESNGSQLWDNVRRTVEDFLYNEWKVGGLLGAKPELAFFVRCDRSTMTQNDLDNGRLICLIGVAPVKPAEFVIFRIGQWTASSNQ